MIIIKSGLLSWLPANCGVFGANSGQRAIHFQYHQFRVDAGIRWQGNSIFASEVNES